MHDLSSAPTVRLVAVSSRRHNAAESLARKLGGVAAVSPAAMAAHADLILLTVGDSELPQMANDDAFTPGLTVVHTSGALDLTVLQPAADRGAVVGSFHPMVSVVRNAAMPVQFEGAVVAIDAGEATGTGNSTVNAQLCALADALHMTPLVVPAAHRARWHAAATLVGNSSAALVTHAEQMLRDVPGDAAVRRAALLGLLSSVVRNLAALEPTAPLRSGISGPIARGNVPIVERHLAALQNGEQRAAYQHAASLVWLAVSPQLPPESRDALARLLATVDLT